MYKRQKVFIAALSALLVFFCVIYGRVETNRMYQQIAAQNQKLEVVQSENCLLYTSFIIISRYNKNVKRNFQKNVKLINIFKNRRKK